MTQAWSGPTSTRLEPGKRGRHQLGGQVQVELRTDAHELPDGHEMCEPVPDNNVIRWVVHLTPLSQLDEQGAMHEVTVAMLHLMTTHSLLIRTRYKNLAPVVRLTVLRLAAADGFMAIAKMLRNEGWRDWHLLTAIANHVANKRFAWEGLRLDRPKLETRQRAMTLAHRPERHNNPQIPVAEFTEETLRFALRTAATGRCRI